MRILGLALLGALTLAAQNPRVRFATNLGNIDVELLQDGAPRTVQNFLNYMNRGDYNGTFFHRSVAGFVIQGGGFRWSGNAPVEIRQDQPIRNEYASNRSNIRGTIAMAKLGSGPDTATNQWFFNLADNSGNLNNQNGGFTVFGRIVDAAGLSVMDRIAAVRVFNAGSPFDQIPLQNYTSGAVSASNLIVVNTIAMIEAPNQPAVSPGGIITASAFGGSTTVAPGSFIEIYGRNLANTTRTWGTADFSGDNAPTTLDGVSVLVGGQPAYVYFVSPGQVNVQVPSGLANGPAGVVLTFRGQSTAVTDVNVRNVSPGLLAPATFKAPNGAQWVAALRPDGSFVSNGTIPGLPATPAPARPDETIIFYGTGFGAVTPGSVASAGRTVREANSVVAPVEIRFGDKAGRITYGGLAPGLVGLYQFNVVVPSDAPFGDVQLNVLVDGRPLGTVTLYFDEALMMKSLALFFSAVVLMAQTPAAKVAPLLTKELKDIPGKEAQMLVVELAPGAVSPVHRHHAHVFVYVLEGSVVMGVKGGKEKTLGPGETFTENPDDIHTVSRNASKTQPAKFVVFMVKKQGAPATEPVK